MGTGRVAPRRGAIAPTGFPPTRELRERGANGAPLRGATLTRRYTAALSQREREEEALRAGWVRGYAVGAAGGKTASNLAAARGG